MKSTLLIICLFTVTLAHSQTDTTGLNKWIAQEYACEDKGDLDSAIKVNMLIMAKYPRVSPFAANTIAGLYGKMNRFRDEINWAKEAIKLNFGYSNSYINLGNGYIGLGITDSARSSFLEAAQLDPKNPYAPYSLGVIEEDNKNYTQALEYYKQSVAIDSNFENGYYNLAATYANLKDFKNAEVCIEKVLKLDPTAADALQMQKHIKYNLKNQ